MWSFWSYAPETVPLRAAAAFALALVVSLLTGGRLIAFLKQHERGGQPIRGDGPKSHIEEKKGTPTMGGLLILGTSLLAMLLFANVRQHFVWISMLVLFIYGLTGFAEDYVKVKKQTPNAMTAKMKLFIQFMAAVLAVNVIAAAPPNSIESKLYTPFFGFSVFMVFAFATGYPAFNETALPYVPKSAEMAVVCAALAGGCVGFLWFNLKKARVFMGDTGSLALGAVLGVIAVILKHEILLAIVGIVFVLETVSVMIQVLYFKKTGKRFFKMAPIHHHFEQLGWSEVKVVYTFWAVTALASVFGLLSLI